MPMTKLEFAKSIGITKNKLNYHLKKSGIELEKIDNQYVIPDELIESLKESILKSVAESPKISMNQVESPEGSIYNNDELIVESPKIDFKNQQESVIESVEKSPEIASDGDIGHKYTDEYIESLKAQVNELKNTVAEKDAIIREKDDQYRALSERMADILLNEQKLKLVDLIPEKISNATESDADAVTSTDDQGKKKKSLWSKLFGKG